MAPDATAVSHQVNAPATPRVRRPALRHVVSPLLAAAFALSLAVHGGLLTIRFVIPHAKPPQRDRGLEVVLVNARHVRPPEKAEALAQANLDGGGASEQAERPKSPLPPKETRRDGDALVDARTRSESKAKPRSDVLTRAKSEVAVVAAPPEAQAEAPERPASGLDVFDSVAAIARMEAQIDRRLEEYAKRPRKKFIGARTREYRFAQYVEDWRQKIERVGTLNYPDSARGRLYGSLLLSVVIRADGSIERIEVQRSSGERILDEAAIRIVELAAPYAAFPPDIRTDTDMLEITRTWTFTRADQVRTQ
jgi:protein TonB